MVLTAIDEPEDSTTIWKLCKERKIPANIADVPPECDFYFGSVHRDGPLQIMVSTNGNGPRLAALVRKQIVKALPPNIGEAIRKVGELRQMLRKQVPEPEQGPKRMKWMIKVCDQWTLDDLVDMKEQDMAKLLGFYGQGTVPALKDLRGGPEDEGFEFDGSFGWW